MSISALGSVASGSGLSVTQSGSVAFWVALAFSVLSLIALALAIYDKSIDVRRNRREYNAGR